VRPLDPRTLGELHFHRVDRSRFPAVELAYAAGRRGGTYPAAMNAANEVAVQEFLDGHLGFTDIVDVTQEAFDAHVEADAQTLEGVLSADETARGVARAAIGSRAPVGAGS
jgi:1-deoxy-D-xylulose-5-phosphate reductoisomerase